MSSKKWVSIGPAVGKQGQTAFHGAVSGRVRGIAFAPDCQRIYIATANGGIWCSENKGQSWRPLMNAFDLNPTAFKSDTLACGAIAIHPQNQEQIFVGSGEAGGGRYFGVGPVVSQDGGLNWQTEESSPSLMGQSFYQLAVDPNDPERVLGATNKGLYRREINSKASFHWVAKDLGGSTDKIITSVVAAKKTDGSTVFYAAPEGGPVFTSNNGEIWTKVDSGFPTINIGRITLAISASNPNIIYALISTPLGALQGVWRLDNSGTASLWRQVVGAPATLFGKFPPQGQGYYDQAIVIAPDDENLIYLGGAGYGFKDVNTSAIYRCKVEFSRADPVIKPNEVKHIGAAVHSDVHCFAFAPRSIDPKSLDPNQLWVGCDGGVFHTDQASTTDDDQLELLFNSRNIGLSTMTVENLSQHPYQDAVVFCHTQDNGSQRYTGDNAWMYGIEGDSGHGVVNPKDPYEVLGTYTRKRTRRSKNGGGRKSYYHEKVLLAQGEAVFFYAPLVGPPPSGVLPERLAFGSIRPWISDDFGRTWQSLPLDKVWRAMDVWEMENQTPIKVTTTSAHGLNTGDWVLVEDVVRIPGANGAFRVIVPSTGMNTFTLDGTTGNGTGNHRQPDVVISLINNEDTIRSMIFASASKLYVGTMFGRVYRCDNIQSSNNRITADPAVHLHTHPGFPTFRLTVTSIAIDPSDPTGNSIYITFGGKGTSQRVWHYDGRPGQEKWQAASGNTPAGSLLDVQHNAIVVDPENPSHLYVGADIGIWRSTNKGNSWEPFAQGIPDAAVVDLKIFPPPGLNGLPDTNRPAGASSARFLRAATHGRGIFEYSLDGLIRKDEHLYIRKTVLDRGLYDIPAQPLDDPTQKTRKVAIQDGPDIKLSLPLPSTAPQAQLSRSQPNGFPFSKEIDFYQFTQLPEEAAFVFQADWTFRSSTSALDFGMALTLREWNQPAPVKQQQQLEELQKVFRSTENGSVLSSNATVTHINGKWRIEDGANTFIVRPTDNHLNVYQNNINQPAQLPSTCRVYTQAHSWGTKPVEGVRVSLLQARLDQANNPPDIPADLDDLARTGLTNSHEWQMLGTRTVPEAVIAGQSQVCGMDLDVDKTTQRGDEFCLLVVLHHPDDDDFNLQKLNTFQACRVNRKIAIKYTSIKLKPAEVYWEGPKSDELFVDDAGKLLHLSLIGDELTVKQAGKTLSGTVDGIYIDANFGGNLGRLKGVISEEGKRITWFKNGKVVHLWRTLPDLSGEWMDAHCRKITLKQSAKADTILLSAETNNIDLQRSWKKVDNGRLTSNSVVLNFHIFPEKGRLSSNENKIVWHSEVWHRLSQS